VRNPRPEGASINATVAFGGIDIKHEEVARRAAARTGWRSPPQRFIPIVHPGRTLALVCCTIVAGRRSCGRRFPSARMRASVPLDVCAKSRTCGAVDYGCRQVRKNRRCVGRGHRFVCEDCRIKWFVPSGRPVDSDVKDCAACGGRLVPLDPGRETEDRRFGGADAEP
jgi:hypothetical protein